MDQITQKADLKGFGYSIVEIETKGNCNMACSFCPYPTKEDKKSQLTDETVYNLIDQIDPNQPGFKYVSFNQYNEPLLDPRIFKFVKYTEDRGIPVKLITNGLLLSQERVRTQLIEAGLSYLKLSVQQINPKTFSSVRGIKMSFEHYCKGVFAFLSEVHGKKTHIDIDVGTNFLSWKRYWFNTIMGLHKGDKSVPVTVKGLEKDLIQFVSNLNKHDDRFRFDEKEIKKFLKNSGAIYQEQDGLRLAPNIEIKVKPFFYGYKLRDFAATETPFSCEKQILGVLADGNVVPCCAMHEPDIKLGNATKQSLNEILKSNEGFFDKLRTVNLDKAEVCRKCYGEPTKRGVKLRWMQHRWGSLKEGVGKMISPRHGEQEGQA